MGIMSSPCVHYVYYLYMVIITIFVRVCIFLSVGQKKKKISSSLYQNLFRDPRIKIFITRILGVFVDFLEHISIRQIKTITEFDCTNMYDFDFIIVTSCLFFFSRANLKGVFW